MIVNRRSMLAGAGAAMAAATSARAVTTNDIFPVVDTAHGKMRGLVSGGISVFKGIRYGASTAGANRFMPPQPVAKWAGVRNQYAYGNYAPQMPSDRRRDYADLIMFDFQPGGMGEDCLVMNLWTPRPQRGAKLPVLFHIHGGGYYGGSGNSPGFDGEKLARFGDCVTITVNHRLGAFGYLDLGGLGAPEAFAGAGVNGQLDLIAALRWVKENIDGFGGDPDRVLIFGQSGGGSKVSVLSAMPGASGLFQRAGIMSGSALRVQTREDSTKPAEALLKQLNLTKGDIKKLQVVPFEDLLAAQATLEAGDRARGEAPRSFGPVLDGKHIPRHPFDPDPSPLSAKIPMIVGTTIDERSYRLVNFDLDDVGLRKFAQERAGARADTALALYRAEDPKASPYLIQARMDSDLTFHRSYFTLQERRAQQGQAPTWVYLWTDPSPAFSGRYGAPHGVDVGMSLHDIRGGLNGPSAHNLALADAIASAWVSFAATGRPNNPKLATWPAFSLAKRETMVFGATPHVENDPRKAIREFWGAGTASAD